MDDSCLNLGPREKNVVGDSFENGLNNLQCPITIGVDIASTYLTLMKDNRYGTENDHYQIRSDSSEWSPLN